MRLRMKLVTGILEWRVARWLARWLEERADELRRMSELKELRQECPPAHLVTSPEALAKLQAVCRGIDKARMVTTGAAYALLTQIGEDLRDVELLMCTPVDQLDQPDHDYTVDDLPAGRFPVRLAPSSYPGVERIKVEPPVYDWVEDRKGQRS